MKGQSALPGFGNLTPAAFINREKGVSSKYAKFKPSGKKASDGSLPDSCVGDVVLEFVLDSANHAITEAQVLFSTKMLTYQWKNLAENWTLKIIN